jgi:hypothetical protein
MVMVGWLIAFCSIRLCSFFLPIDPILKPNWRLERPSPQGPSFYENSVLSFKHNLLPREKQSTQ